MSLPVAAGPLACRLRDIGLLRNRGICGRQSLRGARRGCPTYPTLFPVRACLSRPPAAGIVMKTGNTQMKFHATKNFLAEFYCQRIRHEQSSQRHLPKRPAPSEFPFPQRDGGRTGARLHNLGCGQLSCPNRPFPTTGRRSCPPPVNADVFDRIFRVLCGDADSEYPMTGDWIIRVQGAGQSGKRAEGRAVGRTRWGALEKGRADRRAWEARRFAGAHG